MEQKRGVFYGVSIGPGDPELLTLKAVRLLERTQVIAAPQTKSGAMLAYDIARQAVDLSDKTVVPLYFTMERGADKQRAAHEAAADAVARYLDAGQDVAMLNLGDVSIYATYSYLMEILNARGYVTQMIPGVPSFCACAARLGISLTEMHEPLHIAPGSVEIEPILDQPGTKILMKSGKQLPKVLHALDKAGVREHSAMVRSCGLPDEAVYPNLAEFPDGEQAGYFATIVVKE